MKLTPITLAILKNFATINQGLIIEPGNILSTMKQGNGILASAEVDEEFPVRCEIYNLPKFLQILSVFDEPEIDWQDKFAIISSGKNRLKYGYGEGVTPEPKKIKRQPTFDASFMFSDDDLSKTLKMASILERADQISIDLDDSGGSVSVVSTEGPNREEFSTDVDADVENDISISLNVSDMNVIMLEYKIEVAEPFVRLSNEPYKLWYMIAAATDD